MTSSLFRREATEAQRQRLFGEVVVAQPLSFVLLGLFLVGILLMLAGFVAAGTYTRKETVSGYLQPDKGIVGIYAPSPGVISMLEVKEGETVEAGDVVARVRAERLTAEGLPVNATMLATVKAQLLEIENRIALESRRLESEQRRLAYRIEGLKAERAQLERQIAIQKDLVTVAVENLQAIENLTERGVISETEYKARQERVLGYRQELASLEQRLAASDDQIKQAELEREGLPMQAEQQLSELNSTKASLERQRAELEGQSALTITAPIAGRVTAIRAVEGGRAGNEPLMSILPEGGVLQAHLFVPTRAIGFVEPGQRVRLSYDAFDYRRFGVYDGTVREVSATVLPPGEVPGPVAVDQAVYRVTVALDRQGVDAYGNEVPLQAGMTLSADIIMEERTLVQWLLDPLRSLKGRT